MNFWRCWSVQQYLHFAFGAKIKGGVAMYRYPFSDNLREVAEEESHDQRVDVRTIDVGIGHDDNLLGSAVCHICFFAVFTVHAKTDAQRG